MITRIHIKNFKSLKNILLDARPLSLLMGLNSMGKSSLIQAILILRQSRDLVNGRINLTDHLTEIGKGRDAMYQYAQNEMIKIAFEFSSQNPLAWELKYNPESDFLDSESRYNINQLNEYSLFNQHFQYLKAERSGPRTDYPTSYADVVLNRQVGIDGRYAIHYLNVYGNDIVVPSSLHHKKAKSPILLHQVDAWLSEISPGVKLNTTEIPNTDKVLLDLQFETGSLYTNRFRPKNVGFGILYVLPVIVSLLSRQTDKLYLIENPESHIHPRGQVEMGRLLALAAQSGSQVIVETHSDHILNGIRVAVKEKLIQKDDVGVFNFERITNNEEQYSILNTIKIDANGELSDYPPNFLDEWTNQLLKLI